MTEKNKRVAIQLSSTPEIDAREAVDLIAEIGRIRGRSAAAIALEAIAAYIETSPHRAAAEAVVKARKAGGSL